METIAILAALAFAVNKTVSVLKAIGKDRNAVVTQVLVWGVGIGALFLAAQAQFTEGLIIPGIGIALGSLNGYSIVMAGWMLGSSGSFAFDLKKAIDSSDSAAEPALLKPSAV